MNVNHVGHGAESMVDIIIMNKIETCKKRVKTEQLPLPQIYREEMVKALTENKKIKPELLAVFPSSKKKKKVLCLEGDKIPRNCPQIFRRLILIKIGID